MQSSPTVSTACQMTAYAVAKAETSVCQPFYRLTREDVQFDGIEPGPDSFMPWLSRPFGRFAELRCALVEGLQLTDFGNEVPQIGDEARV